jgi:hypothetical protein
MSLSQLSFAVGAVRLNAMRQAVVGNLGGNWLDCVAVNYWRRLVLYIDALVSTSRCIASTIGKLPCNGGVAKAKGGRQNGGTRNILVTVILRFWCSDIQSDAARVVCNLGGNWINLEQSITGTDLSDTVIC